jgi:hypothetical protein
MIVLLVATSPIAGLNRIWSWNLNAVPEEVGCLDIRLDTWVSESTAARQRRIQADQESSL